MCSEKVIVIENLSKYYCLYDRAFHRIKQALWGNRRKLYREFRALHRINLQIHRGETVGIVGKNGSGKSTLLQIICGLVQPTQGSFSVRGRIAALLELGAGFNPEFTGRENVYMNGSLLGLSRREIQEKMPQIEEFADIGIFMDKPVKMYSSGMRARIAFAVAIHVDPDILIVDEVLSVGDEAFQRKCFAKIDEIRARGATILFVSHSAGTIVELCDRAILLDHGELLLSGEPKVIVAWYQKLLFSPPTEHREIRETLMQLKKEHAGGSAPLPPSSANKAEHRLGTDDTESSGRYDAHFLSQSTQVYGSGEAAIRDIRIEDMAGNQVNVLVRGHRYLYKYTVDFYKTVYSVRFGMLIKTTVGVELGGMSTDAPGQGLDKVESGDTVEVVFPFIARLNPGTYFLNAGVLCQDGGEQYLQRVIDALIFRIEPTPSSFKTVYIDFSVEPAPYATIKHSSRDSSVEKSPAS